MNSLDRVAETPKISTKQLDHRELKKAADKFIKARCQSTSFPSVWKRRVK